tara:strand:- start:408 stop:875 length:468 start_codon:yes stop_codon:yes gene_type:complete
VFKVLSVLFIIKRLKTPNTNKQTKGAHMRSYPIWIDTYNNSYKSSMAKSQGVRDYSKSQIYVGTSANNSYDFGSYSVSHSDNGKEKKYNFYVDGVLVKTATYQKNKKEMLKKSFNLVPNEAELKKEYFNKWKAEEEAKEQEFRNKRYAERLAVNG